MKINEIKINNLIEPLGIPTNQIDISWKWESEKRNNEQKGCQVKIYDEVNVIYDQVFPKHNQNQLVLTDLAFKAHQKYRLELKVFTNQQEELVGQTYFTTGFYNETFAAPFITISGAEKPNVPHFKKDFNLHSTIKEAYLYITALGVYDVTINNKPVTSSFLNPGFTSYKKRLLYQVYDVKELLQPTNIIEVGVAKGWYRGRLGFMNMSNIFGDTPALKLMLVLKDEKGMVSKITSDESFEVLTKQIEDAELYDGECWDFTKPSISLGQAKIYQPAQEFNVSYENYEKVTIHREFKALKKIITPKGEVVYDFGQNMAGFVKICLPETSSGQLTIYHGETLDKDGNFYRDNLRKALAREIYKYDKSMVGHWVQPKYIYHGFRYIKIEGLSNDLALNDLVGCAIATNNRDISSLWTDNPLINQLFNNIKWTIRDNFVDVPTDCPQRDERLGWAGDAGIICKTATYLLDCNSFYHKWQKECLLEYTPENGPAHMAPNIFGPMGASAGWSDSITFVPWQLYQTFGNKKVLADSYEIMKDYIRYIDNLTGENHLWQTGRQYGDWLALDAESGVRTGGTDPYFAANAFYLRSLQIVRDTAKILGYVADYEFLKAKYREVFKAFNDEYVTKSGRLVAETQTACTLVLMFDLVKPKYRKRILESLLANLAKHSLHLTCGFFGVPYLCEVLTKEGYSDIANKVFLQEDFPSWFYAVKMGATTVWERWDSILPDGSFNPNDMNSLNHYADASIGAWIVERIAGLKQLEPGYKKMQIKPYLVPGINKLTYTYETSYGQVTINYQIKDLTFNLEVVVPTNTKALVILPSNEVAEVGSGKHVFQAKLTKPNKMFYTIYDPIDKVMANQKAQAYFKEHYPNILHNPEVRFIRSEGLYKLKPLLPKDRPNMLADLLKAIN